MKELVKTATEIEAMRQGGKILASVMQKVAKAVKPGVSTKELDKLAEENLRAQGATPSFLGYKSNHLVYPASLCTSINSEVVHGLPGVNKILQEGDIIGLDLGCWYKGLCTDHALTVPVGKVSRQASKLIKTAQVALALGLKQVRAGAYVGDIGEAVQAYVEHQGFAVVRALTGHGVGRAVHEEPVVPNFGKSGHGAKLLAGMIIAIEPMVNEGDYEVNNLDDGWTVVTADGKLSAHFEHTVLVTDNGSEVLTRL